VSFESDALIVRRRLKRRLGLWRLAAIVFAAGLVLALIGTRDALIAREHVSRLTVEGIITENLARDRALRRLADDRRVRALIVHIDSPGGTVVGGETLYRRLRDVAAKKPVVAVMGTVAASGGYMTALGADHILARAGTLTGSIGVVIQTADITGLLKKLGIEAESIKSAPLKAIPNPLEELTEEGREATRAVVNDMYEMFVDMVAERRGLDRPAALALADGRVYTGRQAVANRLVDAIGGEAEARAWLHSEHDIPESLPVEDVRVRRPGEDVLGVVGRLIGKTLFSERLTLDGLVSVWHPENG
jgi:protease-4